MRLGRDARLFLLCRFRFNSIKFVARFILFSYYSIPITPGFVCERAKCVPSVSFVEQMHDAPRSPRIYAFGYIRALRNFVGPTCFFSFLFSFSFLFTFALDRTSLYDRNTRESEGIRGTIGSDRKGTRSRRYLFFFFIFFCFFFCNSTLCARTGLTTPMEFDVSLCQS